MWIGNLTANICLLQISNINCILHYIQLPQHNTVFFSTSSLLAIPDVYKNYISQYTNHQIPNCILHYNKLRAM